jgi:hypothetical protein
MLGLVDYIDDPAYRYYGLQHWSTGLLRDETGFLFVFLSFPTQSILLYLLVFLSLQPECETEQDLKDVFLRACRVQFDLGIVNSWNYLY